MKRNDTAPGIACPISFDSILDETCERLMDRQLEYSVLRIRELEKRLAELEAELDEFLLGRPFRQERRNGRVAEAIQPGPFCR